MMRGLSMRRTRDEEAVSTVLGAILVVALLVITLVKIQVSFVPAWDTQRESATMTQIAGQFAQIGADLARHAGNVSSAAVADPITLTSSSGFTFFQSSAAPGTLRFKPAVAGTGLVLSSNRLIIQTIGGQDLFGLSEEWNSVGLTSSVQNVTRIDHLRMRIIDPANVEGSLTLTLQDANSDCAGVLKLVDTIQGGSDNNVESSVFGPTDPPGATCDTTALSIEEWNEKKTLSPAYFYWDAFDANSQFPAVIAAATYPVTITFTAIGVQGDYTVAYESLLAGGGTGHVGGGGQVITDYSSTAAGGVLSVAKSNVRYPSQTYSIEYGAVVLDQPGGSVMFVPPSFTVASTATQTSIGMTLIGLQGSFAAVTGTNQATVNIASVDSGITLRGEAPRLTLALATSHPDLWRTFWTEALQAGGLTSAAGEFTILTTPNTATLNVYGRITPSGDLTSDLFLDLQQANVRIGISGR